METNTCALQFVKLDIEIFYNQVDRLGDLYVDYSLPNPLTKSAVATVHDSTKIMNIWVKILPRSQISFVRFV